MSNMITIGELLHRRQTLTPKNEAIEYDGTSYTWKEVYEFSRHYGSYFLSEGVSSGDHVIIMEKNSLEWIVSFLALQLIGAIAVPINPGYRKRELNYVLKLTDAKYIVVDDCHEYNVILKDYEKNGIKKLKINPGWSEFPICPVKENCSDNVACVLLTSGTTGLPKGVQLTHINLVNNASILANSCHWTRNDSIVLTVPLFHCFGITASLLAAIYAGTKIYVLPCFQSRTILEMIEKKKITILSGVPSMFIVMIKHNDLTKYDLSSIRTGIIAGAPLSKKEYINIANQLGVSHLLQSYGQTETSPCTTISDYDDSVERLADGVGKVIPDVEVRIVNSNEEVLDIMNKGMIEVRGINVMKGYLGEDKQYTPKDWLKTGDIGYLDGENILHICGREKDVIIRGGENVSAIEIESFVKELECVNEARALGVKDEVMGEEVALFISGKNSCNEEYIRGYLNDKLAKFKQPKYIYFLNELPKNDCGKTDDQRLCAYLTKEENNG